MEKGYYAILPANVRYDKNLTPNAKLLYAEITALTNEKGYCWATNSYFAKLYGVSKYTITCWIKNLKDSGYIKVDLIYGEGGKNIEKRYIYLKNADYEIEENNPTQENLDIYPENVDTLPKKTWVPHQENLGTPPKKTWEKILNIIIQRIIQLIVLRKRRKIKKPNQKLIQIIQI